MRAAWALASVFFRVNILILISSGEINNFGRQFVPQFDNADSKSKLAACQMGQLMTKFEAMVTEIWICWRLEELINGEVHPPMEYAIHQDQVREQSEIDQ